MLNRYSECVKVSSTTVCCILYIILLYNYECLSLQHPAIDTEALLRYVVSAWRASLLSVHVDVGWW